MKKYMSIASFSAAIIFAAVGMAIPPQGVIDGSVLILAHNSSCYVPRSLA